MQEKEEKERFLKIWREVLKKVPSPNPPTQKPEIYEAALTVGPSIPAGPQPDEDSPSCHASSEAA